MNPLVDSAHRRRRPRSPGSRALLLAPALAGLTGLSLFAAGCGGSSGTHVAQLASTTSTASTQQNALTSELAMSRCMRSHGVPNFPDPGADGQYPPFHSDSAASKQASASAQDLCKHLLPRGGSEGTPQDRRDKFAFALKVARCLRSNGYPSFPDPTTSSQGANQSLSAAGIDPDSLQFQTAETACEKQARGAS